jgi:hypothetical protein
MPVCADDRKHNSRERLLVPRTARHNLRHSALPRRGAVAAARRQPSADVALSRTSLA